MSVGLGNHVEGNHVEAGWWESESWFGLGVGEDGVSKRGHREGALEMRFSGEEPHQGAAWHLGGTDV